jgi:hypothetical protein
VSDSCALRAVIVMLAVMSPLSAMAQSPVTYGLAGGFTPTRSISRGGGPSVDGGVHAQASVERARVLGRLGLRVDVSFHSFEPPSFMTSASGRALMPGAAVSLVLPLVAPTALVQPYVVAGSGTYRSDLGQASRDWHHGLNAGAGLEWRRGRARPFLESRVIRVFDGSSPRFVPVTLGLRF